MNAAQRGIVFIGCSVLGVVVFGGAAVAMLTDADVLWPLTVFGIVPGVVLVGAALYVRAGGSTESGAETTMNRAQRRVVLRVCWVLAAGCFITFALGFVLPWATYKPPADDPPRVQLPNTIIVGRNYDFGPPDFPFFALWWGVGVPVVLVGVGSFVSAGRKPEEAAGNRAE